MMKVRELVAQLKQMNPELEVRCWYDGEDNPIKNASSVTDVFQISFSKDKRIDAVILTIE